MEDLTTLSEAELWALDRKVDAERARRVLAAKVKERDDRVVRNAKVAAFGTLIADLLAPEHHSKSCSDDDKDDYDGDCTRCKLLWLATCPGYSDSFELRLHADYEPIELPEDAPAAPSAYQPKLSEAEFRRLLTKVLADRFHGVVELPSSLRLSQGNEQDDLCVAITPWTGLPAASLMKRGAKYRSGKDAAAARRNALEFVAKRLVHMLGSDFPLLSLGLQYARAITANGADDDAAVIEFGFEGRHYGLVFKERKDAQDE